MKIFILWLSLLSLNLKLSTQSCQIIKAKNARKYINKEVIVIGKLCSYGNSSYLQYAWFNLGPDSAHIQLKVLIQGKSYYNGKIHISYYVGKEISIKGIVKSDTEIYLDATDTLKLK
jgi:hypothetical protein